MLMMLAREHLSEAKKAWEIGMIPGGLSHCNVGRQLNVSHTATATLQSKQLWHSKTVRLLFLRNVIAYPQLFLSIGFLLNIWSLYK